MIQKIATLLLLLTFFFMPCNAKSGLIKQINDDTFIIVGAAGVSFCFGDVGGSSSEQELLGLNDLVFPNVQYMVSIGFRTMFADRWGAKLSFFNTPVKSVDRSSRNNDRRFELNARILGLDAQAEYYFWKTMNNSAYLFSGIGVANSQIKFKGDPRPGDSYKSKVTAPFIPLGIGYNYQLEKILLGAELGVKYMFSDYIDGVTTKYSKRNDVISYFTLSVSYRIFQGR
jgi:hypothetical protein